MNLQTKMWILVIAMFAILYGVIQVRSYLGTGSVTGYIILTIGVTLFNILSDKHGYFYDNRSVDASEERNFIR